MSAIPQGFASWGTALYPEFGNGIYVGRNPGGSNLPPGNLPYGGADNVATNSGLTIQTDANTNGFISTMGAQPQNVLRITGANGVGYIQGTDIGFAVPYSGNVGVRILPSTNTINVNNVNFVSSIQVISAGRINMQQLVSSIAGYGWANTA